MVGILIRPFVLLDVLRRRIAFRIASDEFFALILVNADIIDAHSRGQLFRKTLQVEEGKTVRHTEVGNNSHRLFRDDSGTDIAVGTHGTRVHGPSFSLSNIPSNVALAAGFVVEGIRLVFFVIVPIVVQVSETRYSLLKGSSAVGIHLGNGEIVHFDEFYDC